MTRINEENKKRSKVIREMIKAGKKPTSGLLQAVLI